MKNIALVAHDGRKKELLEWVEFNAYNLSKHNLYATGTTGKLIKDLYHNMYLKCLDKIEYHSAKEDEIEEYNSYLNTSTTLTQLLSGPLGGDQQIGAMIAEGKIDVLIFFCDNLIMQGHQNDVSALTRLASLYNIAFATNRTTADLILTSPLFNDDNYKRILPSAIESYKNRQI